ncbi:MAG: iron ABC transporter permease [Verrucomicrobiota bacterium]
MALLILVPLLTVVFGLGQEGPKWDHLCETVLPRYVWNTVILLVLVPLLVVLLAIPSAWVVSTNDFPGRRIFEWALVLPLALPTYVAGIVYYELVDALTPFLVSVKRGWGFDAYLVVEKVVRYGMLATLMASVLFPYLYLSARASFSQQRRAVIEAAQTLGRGPWKVFFTVALPLARPAMVAGLSLVVMEVINDYGAVYFFGVPTLTEGIFRTWFGLEDRASALRLAGWIMVAVCAILALERWQRGRVRFAEPSHHAAPLARRALSGPWAWGAMIICLIPLAIGFLYPVGQLLIWASLTLEKVFDSTFWKQMAHSFWLALFTAMVLVGVSAWMNYALSLSRRRWLDAIIRLANIGYAAPGAVVAVGVMVTFGRMDGGLAQLPGGFLLSGTVLAIGCAYLVRFLAVAHSPIQSGMTRLCGSLPEASRVLGRGPAQTLWHIQLPLLRGTLLAATMLVFVDILKELPLTMILRPANFETLATTAFGLAKEGRIQECAVPSLLIVLLGAAGLMVLNRYMEAQGRQR